MSVPDFEGPRGRYHRAMFEMEHENCVPSDDVWVIKLKQILKQRSEYPQNRYSEDNPLYYTLLSIFENEGSNSPRHMLEAMLTTGADFNTIAEKLQDPAFPDGLVLGLYHELFYNIRPYLDSVPMMYRYVVQPLLECNGRAIPLGAIWKLLAYCGGMDVLEASGFGTRPLNAEDLVYLVQLGGYRNAAMMLKYIADGDLFAKDNPVAANIVLGLAELNGKASFNANRDRFGFQKVEEASGNDYSHALTGIFKMVYEPDNGTPIASDIEERLIPCNPTKIESD